MPITEEERNEALRAIARYEAWEQKRLEQLHATWKQDSEKQQNDPNHLQVVRERVQCPCGGSYTVNLKKKNHSYFYPHRRTYKHILWENTTEFKLYSLCLKHYKYFLVEVSCCECKSDD